MNSFIDSFSSLVVLMQQNLPIVLSFVGLIWIIHIANLLMGYRLCYLGIYPRSVHGLLGIFFAPLLHGDFNHVFFNSIPLFVFANFVLLGGVTTFIYVTVAIVVLSGLAIWLVGRKSIHIGASSLIMGYWSYLIVNAYQNESSINIVLAVVTLYYFGGLLSDLLPKEQNVSWEGHLFGFLAGLAVVFAPTMSVYITNVLAHAA